MINKEALRIDIASEFVGAKAFKEAETSTQKLTSSVKSLGRALGITFATGAILNYAKTSLVASAQAQEQQSRLIKLLRVTVDASDEQIASLNAQADALEKLGVVTKGNITQVQSQLATFNLQTETIKALTPAILDYVTAEKGAAASTSEFKQMTNGLAQALSGNFASLTKTGFVLDTVTKNIIKNGNEAERTAAIVAVLDSTYKGFNESLRDTPVGQMQALTNASNDAKEVIGKGLFDAIELASGSRGGGGFNLLTASIKGASEALALLLRVYGTTQGAIGLFAQGKFGSATDLILGKPKVDRSGITPAIQAELKKAAAEKAAAKSRAALLKTTKEQTKAIKEQTALQKAGTLFDIQQTQIIAALKGDISAEERKRLELQLAILTGNTSEASKLAGELAKSQGLSQQLAAYLASLPDAKNPFTAWKSYLDMIEAQVGRIAAGNVQVAPTSMASGYGVTGQQYSLPQGAVVASAAGVDVTVNVNAGSVIAQEGLVDVIRDSLLNDSLQAKFAAIYRQGGSFGS